MGCFDNRDRSRKRPLHEPEGLKLPAGIAIGLIRSLHVCCRLTISPRLGFVTIIGKMTCLFKSINRLKKRTTVGPT